MAERLAITREWLSKLETGDREVSELIQIKIERLEKESLVHEPPHLIKGDPRDLTLEEPRAKYKTVASRIPLSRQPSTRTDCEAYMQQLLDAAEISDNPNAFPVIHDRLRKLFPLDEWEEKIEKK